MNQDKNKEFQDVGELIPTICEEQGQGIEKLIENFNKLKQQNSSLLERVRLLENQDKKENKSNKHELGSGENLLKVPNNSSSDPSSSISASPDISCTDSIGDHKPLVQVLSSSEEELDTDFNEAKSLENSSGYPKKYSDKESLEDPLGIPKKCSQKEHKTAWSKMKEIITTTKVGGAKKRHSVEDPVEINKISEEPNLSPKIQSLAECRLQAPRLVLTHPSTEDLNRPKPLDGATRKAQEKHRPSPLQPTWQETSPVDEEGQGETSPPLMRKSSKWFKVKNVFLPSPGSHSNKSASNPSSPLAFKSFTYEVDPEEMSSCDQLDEGSKDTNGNIQEEVRRNYKQLQKKLSDEFHCKFVEWDKGRKCGGSFSSGNSSVDECERRRFQETEELRSYGGGPDTNMSPPEKKLTSEFKKKLEEWDRLKSGNEVVVPLSPGREPPRRKISDWQGWGRANSQRKKEEGKKRRGSDSPVRKEGHSLKELAWIDKELAKVDKEKLRLEKEREKFNQREARLKKMKLALESSKEEVLIPTSTGTFRFHGISEKFTKKLYEWEKARGIGPEASTIALLDPTYSLKPTNHCTGESSGPGLMRSKSIGSVADLATPACQLTNHPSSLSLNNVGMLEEPMSQVISVRKLQQPEGLSSTAVTPDFSLVQDEGPHLIDSSGSDFDHEIIKLTKKNGTYQYCDESKCLIEKLKKEREMCRELEQNIESLEGRISELSKSLERIDSGGSRNCSMIHDEPFKINGQEAEREEYISGEECDLGRRDDMPSVDKEGLSEIWLVSRDQALNELQHLTEQLLQIVEKLDNWVMNSDILNGPFMKKSEHLNNIDVWMSNHQNGNEEYDNHQHRIIDINSFTYIMKEKISEIRRVIGYLYSKKDDHSQLHDRGTPDDDIGENGPPSYLFNHSDKSQNEIETQDTENDCSSRASSFTYQPAEFRDKHFDESWEWNKPSGFKPYQKEIFPFQHLCDMDENEISSHFSNLESKVQQSTSYSTCESMTSKSDFKHEIMSPMGALKPWDNRSDLNDENQFEIISDISPNIVVPTVRKIFSPVFLEENGETSFIEVVINEDSPKIDDILASVTANENKETQKERSILCKQKSNDSIREQMNSPNLETKEDYSDRKVNSIESLSDKHSSNEQFHQMKEIEKEENSSHESQNELIQNETAEYEDLKEEDEDIQSFFDIGFPPISPLRVRREFKSPKETSSLKRMIAARQNKRLYEIDLNDARNHRSDSSSPDSRSLERSSEIKIDKAGNKRLYNTLGNDFTKYSTSHGRTMSTDRCLEDSGPVPIFPSKGILKSSSTSALKYSNEFDNDHKADSKQRKSIICESISMLEEKTKVSEEPLTTPESLRLRALKIQKAKEDFFNAQLQQVEMKKEVKINEEPRIETGESNAQSKSEEKTIMTKSASEGTVNVNDENHEQEINTTKKFKFSGLASRLNVVLRRSATTSADSSLRRSLAIPSNHQVKQEEEQEPTRSCPSSPILIRDEPAWWSLNPAKKIFRPKGKYKFNNKQ